MAFSGIAGHEMTEQNYKYWEMCMKSYFLAHGLWEVVSGEEKEPNIMTDSVRHEVWRKKNASALHAIQISCSPDSLSEFAFTDSAKFIWEHLVINKPQSHAALGHNTPHQDSEFIKYKRLLKALEGGDWETIKTFIDSDPQVIKAKITSTDETPLNVAIFAGQTQISELLIDLMKPEDIEIKDGYGDTPISVAVSGGSVKISELVIRKNPKAITLENGRGLIPVLLASEYGHKDLTRYLYRKTPDEELSPENGDNAATLLNFLITSEIYDIALDLLQRHPKLSVTKDRYGNYTIGMLAQRPSAFLSGFKFGFWNKWLYSLIQVKSTSESENNRGRSIKRSNDEENAETETSQCAMEISFGRLYGLLCRMLWKVSVFLAPVIRDLHERKETHFQGENLLGLVLGEILNLSLSERREIDINKAIYNATKHGIVEFIVKLLELDPQAVWWKNEEHRTLFALAIVLRQENVFNLIYGLAIKKNVLSIRKDIFSNNFLHLAAKLSPPNRLSHITGAALQMQRELQWFKEVESIVHPKYKEEVNESKKTPGEVFTEEHKGLLEEGEKWMKNIASSSMVIATLIAAIMFTMAFTPPGGSDQTMGVPLLLYDNWFLVFVSANTLSLYSSCTSVLMFFGILTARYSENDFLKALPTKLIVGLSFLFLSMVTMMVAFGTAIYIILKRRLRWKVFIPVNLLASVPITIFSLLLFPLLIEISISTYGPGIFNKPRK